MSEHKETTDTKYAKGADKAKAEVLSVVLQEHDIYTAQRAKRIELLGQMERHSEGHASVGYLAFLCSDNASIDSQDIPAIADALLSIGEVAQLNLIINGPGGDGTVAEKIIQLCRSHCSGQFRVVVPNRAKSAATIIALGSDEIVMGYCSELGPIDAQVPIVVAGIPRYISAQSFIDCKASLEEDFRKAIKAKQDPRAILQQIASLDMPFIDHCGKLMEFSREIARKCLNSYMFSTIKPEAARKKMIDTVLTGLSSVDTFKVHGRMINGGSAKNDLHLAVKLLGKNDEFWKDIWQYYVRADLVLSRLAGASKLIETKDEILVLGRAASK